MMGSTNDPTPRAARGVRDSGGEEGEITSAGMARSTRGRAFRPALATMHLAQGATMPATSRTSRRSASAPGARYPRSRFATTGRGLDTIGGWRSRIRDLRVYTKARERAQGQAVTYARPGGGRRRAGARDLQNSSASRVWATRARGQQVARRSWRHGEVIECTLGNRRDSVIAE